VCARAGEEEPRKREATQSVAALGRGHVAIQASTATSGQRRPGD